MEVANRLRPNAAQMAGFTDGASDGPIYMLNLLGLSHLARCFDFRSL